MASVSPLGPRPRHVYACIPRVLADGMLLCNTGPLAAARAWICLQALLHYIAFLGGRASASAGQRSEPFVSGDARAVELLRAVRWQPIAGGSLCLP
eukprot:6821836-Alexandrium_andersonii.AAC.1